MEAIKEEPIIPAEPPKPVEQASTFYQYVPTEPVVLSPYVEVVDAKQKKIDAQQKDIDELKEVIRQLIIRVDKKV